MTVIPAQVARVKTICVTSPRPSAEILMTAKLLGVENVFRMGGAQAIAALAFRTADHSQSRPHRRAGKHLVAAAKKLLGGEVGIDLWPDPPRSSIIADEADPRHLAADMLAQAEHDIEASAILLTTSRKLLTKSRAKLTSNLQMLPTAPVACEIRSATTARLFLCPSVDAAVEASNRLAPEQPAIYDESLLPKIHSGQRFLGRAQS